jgi:hypothetical protein
MKFASVAATAACLLVALVNAADSITTTNSAIPSAQEALHALEKIDLPAGVTLTGTTEMLQLPPTTTTTNEKVAEGDVATKDHEQFIGGLGGRFGGGLGGLDGGLGGIGGGFGGGFGGGLGGFGGGFGGFGPYRFGFNCGGLGGWAYPLGYWNTFGSGIWGGGCGLGIASGGLFYC